MPSCPPSSHLPLFVVRGVEGDPVCSIVWHFPPSMQQVGFPGGASGKESTCQSGDAGWEDPLEKEMATLSSILAWIIPWTEEPGKLQSMGSQRVEHVLSDFTSLQNFIVKMKGGLF